MKILANDGIDQTGQKMLEDAGYQVDTVTISQDELPGKLNDYDAIIVRSATKVRQDLIDQSPNIKVIARGGVGMDNIDVDYARGKGVKVVNTPAASSQSVAELDRSEEHTSELQSRENIVCRLLLEKKKI